VLDIADGEAYVLYGRARHVLEHEVWCPPQVLSPEYSINAVLDGAHRGAATPARIGLTLRYFRRSWCELGRRPRASPSGFCSGDLVEVRDPLNPKQNPFTYPAWVADARGSQMKVVFVSDGLTAEGEIEAGAVAWVSMRDAIHASLREHKRCEASLNATVARYFEEECGSGSV